MRNPVFILLIFDLSGTVHKCPGQVKTRLQEWINQLTEPIELRQ